MKGRLLGSLFALPFAAVGVWMAWSIGSTLFDAWQMQDWAPVEARLLTAGYETHSGDDSDTYKAYAEYVYEFNGRQYRGQRVGIAGGADNIGDYQQDIGRNLQAAHAAGQAILVYVDPNNPANAVIDRGVRWGLVGFKFIFVIVFGGIGFGLLYAVWRAPAVKDKSDPAYADKPWLLNDDWQSATIRSSSRTAMWFAWGFAVFWNAISSAAPFIAYREIVDKGNWLALIALLFPLVGLGLLVWAVRRTLEWRRFGAAPVTLDPFPGSIGGHVGGTIDLNLPYDPSHQFRLTLTNVHSYESGDSQSEKARWQDSLLAHAQSGAGGTRLTFRFDVPTGLRESDTDRGKDYYLWRLALNAALPGADLDRTYDLPVYETAQQSRQLSPRALEQAHRKQVAADELTVRDRSRLSHGANGKRLYFPMGRHLGNTIGGLLVGGIFVAVGWFLIVQEGHTIFGGIFGGLGALVSLLSFYMLFNSLEVVGDSTSIRSTRRLLGLPIHTRQVHTGDITRVYLSSNFQTQSGGKHLIYYSVNAVTRDGAKLVLGEGFRGQSEANAAIALIRQEFGIRNDHQTGNNADPVTRTKIASIST